MDIPRFSKVWRDLAGNLVRTVLVVLSIALGVFAVGAMAASRVVLSRNMNDSFFAISPSTALLNTDPFDDDLVRAIRNMPQVAAAEGRYRLDVRVYSQNGEWRNLQLFAIPDYNAIQINKVVPEYGAWPPPERALLIERAALDMLNTREGDTLLIETPGRKQRRLPVAGVAHDLRQWPANFGTTAYGYITFETLEWLGETRAYNQLAIIAADQPYDKAHAQVVATAVRERLEQTGRQVSLITIRDPGKHNAYDLIQTLNLMLGMLGVLALGMSCFLVVNTISALLAQQIRQIGIMKAIGARTMQITMLYLGMVVIISALALLLALPLGVLGAQAFSGFILNLFNFDLVNFTIPAWVFALQIGIGLLVPLLASLYPIIAGTRITVREAISGQQEGKGTKAKGRGGFGSVFALLLAPFTFSRPLALSLRNTFRRRGRLALTLITLTLAGSMFIAVINTRGALFRTLDKAMNYWKFDIEINLQQPQNKAFITQEVLRVPGVANVEAWGSKVGFRVRPDGSESEHIPLSAPPPQSRMIEPLIGAGRWLVPQDENAIVINQAFVGAEPDVRVGDNIVLKIEGRESNWRVVGIAIGQIGGMGPIAYMNEPYLARLTDGVGASSRILVETSQHDAAFQEQVRNVLEQHLRDIQVRVNTLNTNADFRIGMAGIFDIFVWVTLVMALLLAMVGGLGLMGLMGLNVLERRREIGVLRAIGASNGAVLRVIMGEGIFIGLLSWVSGIALAIPLSKFMGYSVGVGFLGMPLADTFDPSGIALWFGLAVVLAALASFVPAWHASQVTVRDVLVYE